MSRVLAISGAAGYISRNLIPYLTKTTPEFDQYIGLDIKKVDFSSEIPFTFYKCDIKDDFVHILEEHGVTDFVHLAWVINPIHNYKKTYQVDIEGTKNSLIQAYNSKVQYFLHTSSTLAYGAHSDNPYPITENDELRGNKKFPYSYHKAEAEKIVDNFIKKHGSRMRMGKIRPAPILSYELENFVVAILKESWRHLFLMPYPNKDTPIQFLHISDAIKGFQIMLKHRLEGAFNISPDFEVKMGEIPKILEGRGIRLPLQILRFGIWLQWKLRIYHSPPSYLDFVAYPFVASNEKIKSYGFTPQYTTRDALLSLKKPLKT